MTDHMYDCEVYPNFFSCTSINVDTGECYVFEISTRKDHSDQFSSYLHTLTNAGDRMVGFNNIGFDYPIIHEMLNNGMNYQVAYNKCQQIIGGSFDDRFRHTVWDDQRLVEQIDLYKIHHFDNVSRATSLKALEFNMKSKSVKDLPFPPGTMLTPEQMDVIADYNIHDVMETWRFYLKSLDRIRFREELTECYGCNFMNHNDAKIGGEIFLIQLNNAGIRTHNEKNKPLQSHRDSISLKDVIFPYIKFDHPEFNRILEYFKSQIITETKGVFKDVNCTIDGFEFVFGLGGIHGSVSSEKFNSNEDVVIELRDVASYYPNLSIKNKVYPEHLGEDFCTIYENVYNQRKSHEKGTYDNAALKLALNATYGNSNNKYSPFYDPKFTMTITCNGQLLLCMLAEQLMKIPSLKLIFLNTDGVAYQINRSDVPMADEICDWWMSLTQLKLETDVVSGMWVRDCNNYIMEYEDDT